MKRAAIYARISDDAEGQGLGVARQIRDCQDLARRRGWDAAREPYVDNDVSATRSKTRPAYDRLLTDITEGRVDVVIVWALDRLHRRPIELEHFIALVERHGIELANVAGDVDLQTDGGRLHARILGAVAANEAANTRRRIVRKQQELREAGRPFGGGIRCFGWEKDRTTPIPAEQIEIRHMVEWLLAGKSLGALTRDLNERQVPTVSQWMAQNPSRRRQNSDKGPIVGKPWTLTSVRSLLSKPRIAGLLTYKGEIVGPGVWEPVVDRETFDRLQAVLNTRSQVIRKASNQSKYFLSGIATCGVCGAGLQFGGAPTAERSLVRYRCPVANRGESGGVRHGGRNMRRLDEYVIDCLMTALEVRRFRAPTGEVEDPTPRIEALRRRLIEAADAFAEGSITGEQLQRISGRLRHEISALESQIEPVSAESLLDWYTGSTDREEAKAAFRTLPLAVRRRILLTTLGTGGSIVVHPAQQYNVGGPGGLDTSTIDITWRWGFASAFSGTEKTRIP